jgi:hypothetical protein
MPGQTTFIPSAIHHKPDRQRSNLGAFLFLRHHEIWASPQSRPKVFLDRDTWALACS